MLVRLKHYMAKIKGEKGFSLIDLVMVIVVLAVTIVPISRLATTNLKTSTKLGMYNKTSFYGEALMEEVLVDFRNSNYSGANVVTTWDGYSDSPESSFSRSVSFTSVQTLNSVDYYIVTVTVSSTNLPSTTIRVWILD